MGHSNKAKIIEQPDAIARENPSWAFKRCDVEGRWAITKNRISDIFWDKIYPKLQAYETQTWGEIEGKENHFVEVDSLNKCAKARLAELSIAEDYIFSLRIEGTKRIYGLRPKGTLIMFWYDDDHGDNDTCVCRSRKKHSGNHFK
ncbi:MAG TPA: hypothetical protein PLK94_12175 [Alphaproteobacteria bacterium]|nr:hypothetical protein [Alphaproteobacteria bacterium]HRX08703.1 hypothetical protein [Candidatus Limiplasma sp.]